MWKWQKQGRTSKDGPRLHKSSNEWQWRSILFEIGGGKSTYEVDMNQGWCCYHCEVPQAGRCAGWKMLLSSELQLKSSSSPLQAPEDFQLLTRVSRAAQASKLRTSPSSFKIFSETAREPGLWGWCGTSWSPFSSQNWSPFSFSSAQHVFSSSACRLLGGHPHPLLHLHCLRPLPGAKHPQRRNCQQQKSWELLLGRGDFNTNTHTRVFREINFSTKN